MDTAHAVTGQDPFGSYIDTYVCMHSAGWKNDCNCVREEAHHCVLLLLQRCVHIFVDVLSGVFNILRILAFMMEVRANST